MDFDRLFIPDLPADLDRPAPAPGQPPDDNTTTLAFGEEGEQLVDPPVTEAVGEEGEQPDDLTTFALGEEGEQPDDLAVTTDAVGEEGEQPDDLTTLALGEEGEQSDDLAISDSLDEDGEQRPDPTDSVVYETTDGDPDPGTGDLEMTECGFEYESGAEEPADVAVLDDESDVEADVEVDGAP